MPDPSGMRGTRQLISSLQWTAAFIGLRDPCSRMNAAPCRTARPAKPRSLAAIGCQPSVSTRELPTATRGRLNVKYKGLAPLTPQIADGKGLELQQGGEPETERAMSRSSTI